MDLNQMITLQRLNREKSFSKTAHSLGISQPTVTQRIKCLEEEVGEQLVHRMGRHTTLTEAGEEFLKYINRTLLVYNASQKAASGKHDIASLRLATTSSIAGDLLPDFLCVWHHSHPNNCISLQSGKAEEILDMVKDGVADVGIIRDMPLDPKFQSTFLYGEPLHLAVGPHHSLNQENQPISIDRLDKECLLLYNSPPERQVIEGIFMENGLFPRFMSTFNSVVTVKKMLRVGLGAAFLPYYAIQSEVREDKLKIVEVTEMNSATLSTVAITLRSSQSSFIPKSPILEIFISALQQYCFDNKVISTE